MKLKVYNTLTRQKAPFRPLREGQVNMYVCGPTVYDLLHVGNFRGAIFFNLVRNWLERQGMRVTYVYNYTDVDDKIIKRAKDEGVDAGEVGERYIREFRRDFQRLGLRPHDHNPRVTDFIPQIVQFVQDLVDKGRAYETGGEVFYSVDKFPTYGRLSGKDLEGLNAGERIEVNPNKKNPGDFILWKPSPQGVPGWESPWGRGRPGWHIECSAMIHELLGETIDIHGGGVDLIFPHHENEIAQGEGRTGKPYCLHWMHNNFINFKEKDKEEEKMSKSKGNVILARDFMEKYHPEILKFMMLSVHYRSQINMATDYIHQAISALARIYNCLAEAQTVMAKGKAGGRVNKALKLAMEKATAGISRALNDDFNTTEMVAHIFEVVRVFNGQNFSKKLADPNAHASAKAFCEWLLEQGEMAALFGEEAGTFLARLDEILLDERKIDRAQVEELVRQRREARKQKDWSRADEYRKQLSQLGIELCDDSEETTWQVKK